MYYYELLEKAKQNFQDHNYKDSLYFFQQIESCERFLTSEENLYLFALSIYNACIENNTKSPEIECTPLLKKMIRLLLLSLDLLLPESMFIDEKSERYFLLGVAYLSLGNCKEAKKSFYQSFVLKPTKKNQNNYRNLQKFCP